MSFLIMFINIASIILLILLLYLEVRHFANAASFQLGILTFFALIWATGSFVELLVSGLQAKIFWRNFTQIGTFFVPVATLVFTLAYSGAARKTIRIVAAAFYAIQSIPLVLVLTDESHHLMRLHRVLYTNQVGVSSLSVVSTHLGYIFVSINFLLIVASLCVIVYFVLRVARPMRKQMGLVAVGISIPAVYALLRVIFGEQFGYGIPISSAFAAGCAVLLFGAYKFDFLSLEPIARDRVFDVIDEGIIVISANNHVIDVNQAALRMLSPHMSVRHTESPALMQEIEKLFREYVGEDICGMASDGFDFTLSGSSDRDVSHYTIKTHELLNFLGKRIGIVGVLRDVTREILQIEQFKLRAERDGLTGVYNREAFIGLFDSFRQLKPGSSCLMIFDIDNFKDLNDTYGHLTGDMALKAICACCENNLRADDIFGRIGGDEFAIFFPEADENTTMKSVRRILESVSDCELSHEGQAIRFTISAGVTLLGRKGQKDLGEGFIEAFGRADLALYAAKAGGKNKVVWSESGPDQAKGSDKALPGSA